MARRDGSIFLECGGAQELYHCAFDVALDDIAMAERFASAMNAMNISEHNRNLHWAATREARCERL